MAGRKASGDLRTRPDPGPPPAGVRLESSGGTTRIAFGRGGEKGFAALISTLGRLFSGRRVADEGAICFDQERIWVERPGAAPQWMASARTAFEGAFGPEPRTESLPLDSMPLSAVEQVRVDADATVQCVRLLIEARAGRLEHIGAQSDRKKLEWARDYLRRRLQATLL